MPGRMEFQLSLPQSAATPIRRDSAAPPRLLIMADFSGRGHRGPPATGPDLAHRPLLAVDADHLNAVMTRLEPKLRLPLATASGADLTVGFAQLDDFHPDALYQRLELFQTLRRTRARLLDPAHFAQAAAELTPLTAPEPVHSGPPASTEGEAALLERLLGRTPAAPPTAQSAEAGANALQTWLRTIVQPHIVRTDPRQSAWVAAVDAALGDQMRAILHQPAFQALEATWRGVHGLVANLDDDAARVFLLDVTREELLLDLRAAGGKPQATSLHTLLIERGVRMPDGQPWTLLVGDYAFGAAPEDIALLAMLGALAAEAGGPFLAAAEPATAGVRLGGGAGRARTLVGVAGRGGTTLALIANQRGRALARPGPAAHPAAPALWPKDRAGRIVRLRGDAGRPRPRGVPLGQSGSGLRAADRGGVRGKRLGFQSRRRAGTR